MIIMVSVGIAAASLQILIYVVHNRRLKEGKHEKGSQIVYTP